MDTLKNKTQTFFTREQVTGDDKDTQTLERKIKDYNKTGKFAVARDNFSPTESFAPVTNVSMPNSPKGVASAAAATSAMRVDR